MTFDDIYDIMTFDEILSEVAGFELQVSILRFFFFFEYFNIK